MYTCMYCISTYIHGYINPIRYELVFNSLAVKNVCIALFKKATTLDIPGRDSISQPRRKEETIPLHCRQGVKDVGIVYGVKTFLCTVHWKFLKCVTHDFKFRLRHNCKRLICTFLCTYIGTLASRCVERLYINGNIFSLNLWLIFKIFLVNTFISLSDTKTTHIKSIVNNGIAMISL
jgi:hypothetical protein